jgi:hypothetical protein
MTFKMPTTQEELKGLKPLLNLAEYVDNFHKNKTQVNLPTLSIGHNRFAL